MSFRELRNFCEIMRSLGYHRPISMENFRQPNFELVADLLDWILHRYDSSAAVPDDISTEQCRVHFLTTCCRLILDKTNIKVNPRKLYGADGYAVKELLRVAQMLYDAQKSITQNLASEAEMETSAFSLSSKLHDLKSTRSLCSSIVDSGATLHELLMKEHTNREERQKALRFLDGISRNLESNSEQEIVERSVTRLLNTHTEKVTSLRQTVDELSRDEKNLESKIKKKKQELDRCSARLGQLTSVRPAFMDEYEKLEEELAKVYDSYVQRFRNLDYLEYELDHLNKEEEEKMEQNARELKRLQKRLREEEWRMLRGDEDGDTSASKPSVAAVQRPRAKSQVTGSMLAVSEGSSESDDGSSEAISVGRSEGSDHPLSISGSDDILEQSEESSPRAGGGGNDHNF
ncbi:unnamed protein product [Amoebophrya sp. A25]|nr:unnamed protein product [Amoebophrya sp. A25]|eukprot:GSA25T00005626001.1